MIQLIVGSKGAGKTKHMVEEINRVVQDSTGSVVCVEKNMNLTFDLSHKVRLIDVDTYGVEGFDMLYGFIAGVLAGNYDISHLYIDGTLRIGNRDMKKLPILLERVHNLTDGKDLQITFTLSCEPEDLPEDVQKYL